MSGQKKVVLNDDFVSQNIGLVHACCHKLEGRGIEYDELFSAGCLGLCKAVKGFDNERGSRFSTYAVPVILGEIKRLFRDGGTVKVGRTIKERSLALMKIKAGLTLKLKREPTLSELSSESGFSVEQVSEAIAASAPVISLTREEGENGQNDITVEGEENSIISKMSLLQALDRLDEDERELIRLRYFEEITQNDAAKRLCTNQAQISRREKAILLKLRKQLI